ncbi:glutaredoxin-like protein NrdH [Mixta hanseatica]|uniref:Glutaredoxin-like protein NrdH n=1 Tax=Mixta hanseatica TaxID=2872648 RepID=A0ABY4R7V6_9GAMM|nr:glutaredoxin-like protein NrdH [Mixta hanseatica]UQY43358.1 glutaredoxin-like protein NrdH [Mixta hanseatica]
MLITIYTKNNCMQCTATKNMMDKLGLPWQLVNLDEEPAALEDLKALGYRQLPVVMADEDHWSGFRPDKLIRLTQVQRAQG